MNPYDAAPPRKKAARGDVDHDRQPRTPRLRLNPIVAVAIAAAALTMIFTLETDPLGLRLGKPTTVSPAEAVDISLQRLLRLRVAERLQAEHRLISSPSRNGEIIADELNKIREHPLYALIKEKMADHLRNHGYVKVPIRPTPDPSDPMLAMEAELSLNGFTHTLRASFPAPDDRIANILKEKQKLLGESIVNYRGADGCDTAFTYLITLLYDHPDEVKPVASTVRFVPRSSAEIERTLRGASRD